MKQIIILLFVAIALTGCEKIDVPKGTPKCIKKKIREFLKVDACEAPFTFTIYQYEYNGETVFLVNPTHCGSEMTGVVYDEKCNYICAPVGGFGGGGDAKCTDFFQTATNEQLIWQDDRE